MEHESHHHQEHEQEPSQNSNFNQPASSQTPNMKPKPRLSLSAIKNTVIILILLVLAVVIIYGYWLSPKQQEAQQQQNTENSQPYIFKEEIEEFTFSDEKGNFKISKGAFEVLTVYNAEDLFSANEACGTNKTQEYFRRILLNFSEIDEGVDYFFHYEHDSQKPTYWQIRIMPNRLGYRDLGKFKEDFDVCSAGANAYPLAVSEKYLMFASSCGSGFDDGSGRPVGCDEIRKVLEPTIELN